MAVSTGVPFSPLQCSGINSITSLPSKYMTSLTCFEIPPSPWNPSADRASMDRKSRILIVSFFNYIQVISHGKVGGKVCRERQDSTFQSYCHTLVLVIKSLS